MGFQLGGDTRLQAWVMLLAAGLNILLNLLLIPSIGLLGAVYSTVIVYVVSLAVSLWLVQRSFPLPRLRLELLAPVAATGGLVLALLWLPAPVSVGSLLLQILLAGAVYLLVLVLLLRKRLQRMSG